MSLIVHIRKRLHNFELISDFETDGQLALLGASELELGLTKSKRKQRQATCGLQH